MYRREFIKLIGGAAASWPLQARAQSAVPVIGYLHSDSPERMANLQEAFREGLRDAGYVEGRNVVIEYRWGNNGRHPLSELVADLVSRRVAVIAAPGTSAGALAAKAATTTIPIVFSLGVDPVKLGLVVSLARPGGNITGVNSMSNELMAKRVQPLHELLPAAKSIAVLVNQNNATSQSQINDANAAATAIGLQLEVFKAGDEAEIDKAFASLMQSRPDALLIGPDALLNNSRNQIVALSVRHRLPTIYPFRTDAEAGGLMSYGTSLTDAHRLAGFYTGRILKGEKPADLPVVQPTKFDLVINRKSAKALGLTVPPSLLATADEVIE
jgi:putative ABC transport system substrate-binding protein